MCDWRGRQGSGGGDHDHFGGNAATPGRRTLTEDLPSGDAPATTGRAAPDGVRRKVEAATGADLGGVRVHDDADSHTAATEMSARAFTVGQDVYLGAGERSDERLMAHELAHTVQQRGQSSLQLKPFEVSSPHDVAEHEADQVADAALEGRRAEPITQQPVAVARQTNSPAPAPPPSTEARQRLSQTMTSGTGSWNNTFGWDSKMHVSVNGPQGVVTTTVRLFTTAPQTNRTTWENAIESRWSRRFDFIVNAGARDSQRYVIVIDVVWVNRQSDAHYTITAIDPAHPPPNRTLGRGGTVSMTEWGTGGTQEIPHEFGHMLGNYDEYNTVNGVNRGAPHRADGNIMNNPANLPTARHYDGIRRAACGVLRIAEATSSVRPTAGPPTPLDLQHGRSSLEGQDGPIPLSPPGTAIA